ncbi:MAG TPA: acetylxylan esterase [Humisphaera sp.]
MPTRLPALLAILLLAPAAALAQATRPAAGPMVLDPVTLKAPKTYPAEGFKADGVTAVFLEAMPYKGKPTRAFAWYGVPKVEPGKKVPAMVLVHGGGGTAFANWVKVWVDRGYAAIAVDTCGQVPKGTYGKWERHEHSGPAGWGGLSAADVDLPPTDQWTYHAISDVALSHSLLASFPEVDADRIGVTGVSWGGYLTCISAGVDRRYKLAVPVYGCGFLGDNSTWLGSFEKMGKDHAARWLAMWDPSQYLPKAMAPTLWVTGTNDFAYPMDSLRKSYRQPMVPPTLCVTIRMKHGHGPVSEQVPEIFTFVDAILKGGAPLATVGEVTLRRNTLTAVWVAKVPVKKAEIAYTTDVGPWQKREWKTAPATVDAKGDRAIGNVPMDAKVCYMNLIDERGLTVSTEHIELP